VSLLQSKIGRHDKPDQHVCGMAAAFRPCRRHSTLLRGGNGAGSVLRLGTATRGADGAGLAEVRVPKWFMVYNHLHTVHAIAACNAAEVAMGMLMEATVPATHRWIPKAMTVHYLEKATMSLRARAQLEPPDFTQITDGPDGFELVVPVTVTDRSGTEVGHADSTTWVTPVG
jgi:Domain of unknown function (DUF4442)